MGSFALEQCVPPSLKFYLSETKAKKEKILLGMLGSL